MDVAHRNRTESPRYLLTVRGIVQGVGFRPYVFRLAEECAVSGWVCNNGEGVQIDVQGPRAAEFIRRLPAEAPPLVMMTSLEVNPLPAEVRSGFRIEGSSRGAVSSAVIPPDVAVCPDCLSDLFDPSDRRYRYPFTNCTNCGPRYSITSAIPYDRPMTSMAVFPMCPACAREYGDPRDRRFHAQPNACPVCGPTLLYRSMDATLRDAEALDAAVRDIAAGRIVAMRGLGGYHLVVDAGDEDAVLRLRARKRRYLKPLAVMVRDLPAARGLCVIDAAEEAALGSPQCPIVLLHRRADAVAASAVAPSVAPGSAALGVMLPYTPLHHLLLRALDRPLVMTSGNLSEEPICIAVEDAEKRLGDIADGFLHHDRDILVRCDDSVVQVAAGAARPVRRARGAVPRPVVLADEGPSVLAVGAELKNTICLTRGRMAFLGQHVGDLENLETLRFFEECATHLMRIFEIEPAAVVHDLHPDYLGTKWALGALPSACASRVAGLPRIGVQHHHAHFAACLAENGCEDGAVGIILDGTGYGTDGTVWGGEFFVGTMGDAHRVGRFAPLPMPGGAQAVRQPWRMACAALAMLDPEAGPDLLPAFRARRAAGEIAAVRYLLATGENTPHTSSAGRYFDAVASLLGVADVNGFEAQAAMLLEQVSRNCTDPGAAEPFPWAIGDEDGECFSLSFEPAIREIISFVHNGADPGLPGARFHATVAAGCADAALRVLRRHGLTRVALSGGVFQNRLLFEDLVSRLTSAGCDVLTHRLVPANDGGIALGQAAVARAQIV